MAFNYTVEALDKNQITIKFEDERIYQIPIRTWWDKERIESEIRMRYNEEDLGTVDDIPFKVGDTNTIKTVQELQKEFEDETKKAKEDQESTTYGYKSMRRLYYPFCNDQVAALQKAVLTGDKSELEEMQKIVDETKAKFPKDDKKYTQEERNEAIKNNKITPNFSDIVTGAGLIHGRIFR
tara:strand:- start:181 stop:723 length:543 start_codon:yes stop_codon:yes gene_type:complete